MSQKIHFLALLISIIFFAIFINFTSANSSRPTHHSLGSYCNRSSQCSTNAICGAEKCICKFSYIPSDNGIDCQELECNRTLNENDDCTKAFGPNTKCYDITYKRSNWNSASECRCAEYYQIDRHTQKCKSTNQPLGGDCSRSSYSYSRTRKYCGGNAYCSYKNGCICQFGYEPSEDGINCRRVECYYDSDCARLSDIANSTFCQNSDYCSCREPNFNIDSDTQKCIYSYYQPTTSNYDDYNRGRRYHYDNSTWFNWERITEKVNYFFIYNFRTVTKIYLVLLLLISLVALVIFIRKDYKKQPKMVKPNEEEEAPLQEKENVDSVEKNEC